MGFTPENPGPLGQNVLAVLNTFEHLWLYCSADPGQRLLALEGMLGELLEKRARLQRLLRAEDMREMLAFFRDNGVIHESGRAVQKLLEQEELLKGNSTLSKSGTCMAAMHCTDMPIASRIL